MDPSSNLKPNIALFHYSGPPKISGVDNIVRDQARLFRLHKYKVSIIAGIGKKFRQDIPVKVIQRMNPRHELTFEVSQELERGIVSRKFKNLETSLHRGIKKYLITNNITVCILHNLFTRPYNLALTSALAKLIEEMPQVKFIAWVHDTVYYDEPDTTLDRKLSLNYPWNLLVTPVQNLHYVCVSTFLKDNLVSSFGKTPPNITVIPNGTDVEKFLALSPAMRAVYYSINGMGTDLIACIPVRAIPRKNLELALYITRSFVDRGLKFKLLLTGNVDYKREKNLQYYLHLKKLCQDLGIKKNVVFLEEYFGNFFSDQKKYFAVPISELFLISDFLLFTSKVEGFGLPILEAGLMRCPIFSVDLPPIREIGSTNINYFTNTMMPNQVADFILEKLKGMPQSYFYRKIIKKFSLHTIFQKRVIPLVRSKY